jgi:hypothetical protein
MAAVDPFGCFDTCRKMGLSPESMRRGEGTSNSTIQHLVWKTQVDIVTSAAYFGVSPFLSETVWRASGDCTVGGSTTASFPGLSLMQSTNRSFSVLGWGAKLRPTMGMMENQGAVYVGVRPAPGSDTEVGNSAGNMTIPNLKTNFSGPAKEPVMCTGGMGFRNAQVDIATTPASTANFSSRPSDFIDVDTATTDVAVGNTVSGIPWRALRDSIYFAIENASEGASFTLEIFMVVECVPISNFSPSSPTLEPTFAGPLAATAALGPISQSVAGHDSGWSGVWEGVKSGAGSIWSLIKGGTQVASHLPIPGVAEAAAIAGDVELGVDILGWLSSFIPHH